MKTKQIENKLKIVVDVSAEFPKMRSTSSGRPEKRVLSGLVISNDGKTLNITFKKLFQIF